MVSHPIDLRIKCLSILCPLRFDKNIVINWKRGWTMDGFFLILRTNSVPQMFWFYKWPSFKRISLRCTRCQISWVKWRRRRPYGTRWRPCVKVKKVKTVKLQRIVARSSKGLFTGACAQILVAVPDSYLWREKVLLNAYGFWTQCGTIMRAIVEATLSKDDAIQQATSHTSMKI